MTIPAQRHFLIQISIIEPPFNQRIAYRYTIEFYGLISLIVLYSDCSTMSNSYTYQKSTLIGNWYEDRFIPQPSEQFKHYHTAARSKYDKSQTPIQINNNNTIDYTTSTTHHTYIQPDKPIVKKSTKLYNNKILDVIKEQQPQLVQCKHNNEYNLTLERHLITSNDLIFPQSSINNVLHDKSNIYQSVMKQSYQSKSIDPNTLHIKQINAGTGETIRFGTDPKHNTLIQRSWCNNTNTLQQLVKHANSQMK